MADGKQGEGRGAGAFELGRRYEEVGPGLGRLHEAWQVDTGRPALRLFLTEQVEWQPSGRWEVLIVCEASPTSLTFLVERGPAEMPASELGNVLVLTTAAFKRVEDNPRLQAHLRSGLAAPAGRPLRSRWKGRARAGWAAAGFALGCGVWLVASPPRALVPGDASALLCPTDAAFLAGTESPGLTVASYPLPDTPFRNQAKPPCKKVAVEINGGCWVTLEQKPPCGDEVAEHKGKCYLPAAKPERPAQSVDP